MEERKPMVKVKSRIGSIHSEEVYAKYKENGACEVVLGIISRGVPSFFLTTDIPKFPRGGNNNDSATFVQLGKSTLARYNDSICKQDNQYIRKKHFFNVTLLIRA